MSRRTWTLTAAGLIALVVVGCATMQAMTPDEAIAKRQQLMKDQGAAWKNVQDKTKAGNIVGIAADAQTLADTAKQVPALFPEGSLKPDKSAAKPEIWQKWADFEAAAKNLQAQAEKLRDTAKTGDAAATQAVVSAFGRNACGTCHTPFRVPPKQS